MDPASLRGRTLSVWYYVEGPPIQNGLLELILIPQQADTRYVDVIDPVVGTWAQASMPLDQEGDDISMSIKVFFNPGAPWKGRLYLDDIRVQ
jgi:hypothetical protein